jgi:AcrR family transcriptional regulator
MQIVKRAGDQTEARRIGRPPKVTRNDILDAAARHENLAGLQLTQLASDLGISVKTVYYYFAGRQEVMDGLTERAVVEMGLPNMAETATWPEVFRENAIWYFRLGFSQPGWVHDPNAPVAVKKMGVEVLQLVCDKLGALGWTKQDAYRAHILVSNWALTLGESVRKTLGEGHFDPENVRRFLSNYTAPAVAEALSDVLQPFQSEQEVFEDGLHILLAGIDHRIVRKMDPVYSTQSSPMSR